MSKILIVPDIHEEIDKVDYILSKFEYDKVVFLGDYFDTFGPNNVINTCNWLVENINNPNYTFLLGNHDQHYFYGLEKCSGYDIFKHNIIKTLIPSKVIDKIKLYTFVDNWLCSHAGVHPEFLVNVKRKEIPRFLEVACNEVLNQARQGSTPKLLCAGWDRGGRAVNGGITWQDWANLEPTPHLNQLVGHTNRKEVRSKITKHSKNYCIDTALRHVAIIKNSEIEIFEV